MAIALRKGDKSKAVREIQGLLNSKAGKILVKPDGDFGAKTEAAVKEFQTNIKLRIDGIVGQKTWDALHNQALPVKFDTCFGCHDWFSLAELEKFFANLLHSNTSHPATTHSTPAAITQPVKTPTAQTTNAEAPTIVKREDFKNYQLISFNGYQGQGYVIKNFKKFEGGAIQLRPEIKIIESNEKLPTGFRNECASLVQYFGIPNTRNWLRGPRVCDFKPGELPVGTVVATLRDGKYYSDYSGRSHVGIYLSHNDYGDYLTSKNGTAGVTIMEQSNGLAINPGTKKYAVDANGDGSALKNTWLDSTGSPHSKRVLWGKDGEEYYVLLTKI